MATEKRLIDANELSEHQFHSYKPNHYMRGWNDAISAIMEEAPTVDAVEVVHGYMVERIDDHECPWYTIYDCSECGYTVERWYNYCPNCGAKMDGDSV